MDPAQGLAAISEVKDLVSDSTSSVALSGLNLKLSRGKLTGIFQHLRFCSVHISLFCSSFVVPAFFCFFFLTSCLKNCFKLFLIFNIFMF